MRTIAITQDYIKGSPGEGARRPHLIHIGKAPRSTKGAQEYQQKGYHIENQRGFYGLVISYWKDEQTLRDHTNPYYHKQIKQ